MPAPGASFQAVLSEAIDDLLANGFDSMERVDRWTRALREAAEREAAMSPISLEEKLRSGLAAIYRKLVDKGGIARYSPGIERFTIEKVRPALRAELDRRIMASANLIKLNRAQAIDKTLQRFSGWSTSIPKGGTSVASRREVKANVRKSIGSLPFEERRVLIDQGHKLTSALSEILASDGGAIAGEWRSHWRQAGYDYREDHKERDGQVYLVRDSWAHRSGLAKPGPAGYTDSITKPAEEVFCRCYYRWIFNLRSLPEEMLTAKGKRALAGAITVGAFADEAEPWDDVVPEERIPQADAVYGPTWANPQTRCARCSMFVSRGGLTDNLCTAVDGAISAHGHCRLFEVAGVPRAKPLVPVPVDREHDVAWMFVVSATGQKLYVDRTLPRAVTIRGRTFDPAEIGWAHEHGEFVLMLRLLLAFQERFGREPDEAERIALYYRAHEQGGIPAERAEARRMGVDWDAWEAWSRGELSRLEHRRIRRPPPDPHVKPAPHDRREPMASVA